MEIKGKLPEKILSWRLKGAGLDNFGTAGKPDLVPFPSYTEDDLIARIDASGICFSDVKLISGGNEHPRIKAMHRDLSKEPTVPGHEISLTIVGVGERRKGQFKIGDRYIVQADVFYKGVSMAFGYVIPGGFSEYVIIGKELLDGDDGCYLIPVKKTTGYAEAALVEPWTCVVASYQIKARTEPRNGGCMYVYGAPDHRVELDFSGIESSKPCCIVHEGLDEKNLANLKKFANSAGIPLKGADVLKNGTRPIDTVITGLADNETLKKIVDLTDNHGYIGIHTDAPSVMVPIDVGSIHYRNLGITGSTDGKVLKSYSANTRETLKPGGNAWFVGGAGPMGQMHIIKAIQDPQGPQRLLISDLSDDRMQSLKERVSRLGVQRPYEIEYMNPGSMKPGEFDAYLRKHSAGGFDDVIILVPVPAVITHASTFAAENGVVNVFAGVKVGTIADLPLDFFTVRRVRVVGSSGSPLDAMIRTLELTEAGKLSTNISLSAVADMDSVSKGVKAVMDGVYTGKVVVFPGARGFGIKSVEELAEEVPEIKKHLVDGKYWSNEAEAVFMQSDYFKRS